MPHSPKYVRQLLIIQQIVLARRAIAALRYATNVTGITSTQ